MKHLISIDDISSDDRAALFQVADKLIHPTTILKKDRIWHIMHHMTDKILANVFY